MIDRLDAREEGLVPIQCHVTFMKRATREWLRFVDRHPLFVTGVLAVAILTAIGLGVWRLV
jgi:eukaryotic-like serine/threonine-protein kinase